MRLPRVRGRAVLITALAGTGVLISVAVPTPAAAAVVTGISTPGSGGIDVHLSDPDALWVRANVRASSAADAPVLASTDDLTFDATRGWYTDSPIRLPDGTGYGDYPVDIDYRLADGTTQHVYLPSTRFRYRKHARIANASFDRTFTDYDHPTATLTGTVETFDPASDTTAAAAGTSVRIAWTASPGVNTVHRSTTVITDGAGHFAARITPGGRLSDGTVVVANPAADTDPAAPVAVTDLDTRATSIRIAGGPVRARVHAGGTFLVSGTVQRLTASGWRPLSGASVVTTPGSPDYWNYTTPGLMGSGTTDAAGHFVYRAKAVRRTAASTYVRYSPYVDNLNLIGSDVNVPTAGSYLNLALVLDEYGSVKATGALAGNCGRQIVALQYSRTGASGWTTIGSATSADKYVGRPCRFAITAAGGVDGYYRVAHAESDYMLANASAHRRLHRILTMIAPFTISPEHAARNSTLTATGRLTQRVGRSWRSLPHGEVVLVYRPKGNTTWYWVAKGFTARSGSFTLHGKAYGPGSWGVYYAADAGHFYSESQVRNVDVR